MELDTLYGYVAKAQRELLNDAEAKALHASLQTLGVLMEELKRKGTTLRRLQAMLEMHDRRQAIRPHLVVREHDRYLLVPTTEIQAIEDGRLDREDNPLKHAPHTATAVSASQWTHAYPRELAAFPLASLKQSKYWPPVARVDNVYGDRHLVCSCAPIEAYADNA